jgi:16S rRNA (uracil1498-N3)-methyltransferase
MSIPRFYAPDAGDTGPTVRLSADEAHHLTRVLRFGVGDVVSVFDGAGREWSARVASTSRGATTVELGARTTPAAEPPVRVTLAIGLLKGDQMDTVVRDATMLGAAAIVPMTSTHVAVHGRARQSASAIERWQRVAVASAKQCGRAVVPAISPVGAFDEVLRQRKTDVLLMCVEPARAAGAAAAAAGSPPTDALALIGPEGGWADREISEAVYAGARLMHLGPRTLRAETAPTVALSALWSVWGW